MKKKNPEKFFIFQLIPSDFVALYCLYIVLRFCISLLETFCRTIDFPVIKKYGKGAVLEI